MADRRVWPWLAAALADWALLISMMIITIIFVDRAPSLVLQVCIFTIGMWAVGVIMYRLSILGHDAGHRTITPRRGLNDALGNLFVFYPALVGLEGYRLFHNEGHHPKANTSTLRDPEIVMRKFDRFWGLPLGRAAIARRFVYYLLGGALPSTFGFMFFTSTPRVYARFTQFLMLGLKKRDGIQAQILPARMKGLENSASAIVLDILGGIGLVLFKLCAVALLVWGLAGVFGYARWPLILGLWYGGMATSFWSVFSLRNLFEHVGTSTVQLREPSPLWKFFVFPHGIWAHLLHHHLPRMPFHRLKDVLRARQAQGIAVRDVAALLATSMAMGPGEIPPAGDERDIMDRAAQAGLLGPVV